MFREKLDIFKYRGQENYPEMEKLNLRMNQKEIQMGKVRLKSTPRQVQFDLIGICDMKPPCVMCDIDEKPATHNRGLDIHTIMDYNTFLINATHLSDGCTGEPLVHPQILILLSYLWDIKKSFSFSSNGVALTKEMSDTIIPLSKNLTIVFSLDSASSQTYSQIRGNHFDRILTNIRYFTQERKERLKMPMAPIGLCFIPMRSNCHEIEDFINLAAKIGIDFVELRALNQRLTNKISKRGDFEFSYHHEFLSLRELSMIQKNAEVEAKKIGIPLRSQFDTNPLQSQYFFKLEDESNLLAPCTFPWRFVKLIHDGRTFPCAYITKSMGDWRKLGLNKVWNCKVWRDIRRELSQGKLSAMCLNFNSCPLVRKKSEPSLKISKKTNSTKPVAKQKRFSFIEDNNLKIHQGVYKVELDNVSQGLFRWSSDKLIFSLPNLFTHEPWVVCIPYQTDKPSILSAPLVISIKINQKSLHQEKIFNNSPGELEFIIQEPFNTNRLTFQIDIDGAWVPGQYKISIDGRLLGIRLTDIIFYQRRC